MSKKEGKNKYMRKIFILLCLAAICIPFPSHAALRADTNLAQGKNAAGTFSDASVVTDGKLRLGRATSGTVTDTPQFLTIDLGTNLYLDRVKITWDKDSYSKDFVVRTSSDAKYWVEELGGLDASNGVVDDATGTIALSVSLKKSMISSRYVQVMIPASSAVSDNKTNKVKIAEIEIYPSLTQKFTIDKAVEYAITGNSCVIKYDTSIGAANGSVVYGTDPMKMEKVAVNAVSGIDNSVVISGLEPRRTYYYQVKATDFYGNTTSSKVFNFTTDNDNVALKKPVTGTFTVYPLDDKYVKPGNESDILSRVTDGSTSYFTSMATSGPVPDADQFVVIDLGKSYNIKNVVTYWRRLAYPESLSVQLSDNDKDWKTVESNVDVGSGAAAWSDAGDPMAILNTKGGMGRYVKLLVPKGSSFFHKHENWNFVQLMEVQVYSE